MADKRSPNSILLNTLSPDKATVNKNKGGEKTKKLHLLIISIAVTAATFFWGIGVGTDLFASTAFSSFWWLSYETAHYAQFVALSIGGAAMLLAVNFWFVHNDEKRK